MSWTHIYEYLTRLSPEIADLSVGIPEDHIAACERGLDLVLPACYREFLRTMGGDAGPYHPMGGYPEWNFYELLREPPDDYNPQDLFRIATDTYSGLTCWCDLYIDMTKISDVGDCDVLELEWDESSRDNALGPPQTLLELLAKSAWRSVDMKRFSDSRVISVHCDSPTEKASTQNAVQHLLEKIGFALVVQPTSRVQCLWLGNVPSVTARVDSDTRGLTAFFAGNDTQQLKKLTQILLDNISGAWINPRFSSLHSKS